MEIQLNQPFNLKHTLECGQAFRWQKLNDWYFGVVNNFIIKIKQTSDSELGFYTSPGKDNIALITKYFRLNDDLTQILSKINRDKHIKKAINQLQGLRLLRQDPWECLISYVCSAASNIPQISKTINKLSEQFGEKLVQDYFVGYTFPTSKQLANTTEKELRKTGMGFRAKYVSKIAKIIENGSFTLEEIKQLDYTEAKNKLMVLLGVGHKIADCVLLYSLDKLGAFPIDRWVRRIMHELYFDKKASDETIGRFARDYFGKYAGYAQLYLFYYKRLNQKFS
ncbi:MAG: DNA-3-methyladenine glycosylase 2 family protein [Euryarchaeota archaeon]|nr:DNA-3-methyladenine glycosylase 2 family protein [Euryarchaeota archaeon]